jgi:hypothetical protein
MQERIDEYEQERLDARHAPTGESRRHQRELNIIVPADQDRKGGGEYDRNMALDSPVRRRRLMDARRDHQQRGAQEQRRCEEDAKPEGRARALPPSPGDQPSRPSRNLPEVVGSAEARRGRSRPESDRFGRWMWRSIRVVFIRVP